MAMIFGCSNELYPVANQSPTNTISEPAILLSNRTLLLFCKNRRNVWPPLAYINKQLNSVIRIIATNTDSCGVNACAGLINGGQSEIINTQPFGLAIAVTKPWLAN